MTISATTQGLRPGVCTSTSRPSAPFDGQVIYETDTNTLAVYDGSGWVSLNPVDRDRNVVINGAMQIAQRNTSVASITGEGYNTADRWRATISALGTWTQSVENDAPTGSGLRKSLKMLVTTADASPSAADYALVEQRLEGQNVQKFKKGTSSAERLTVSFWVKANVTGTFICGLYDADNTRHVAGSYTISASATWEKKTITFPADTTGAFDNDNAESLRLWFWLAGGSNHTSGTLATTWASYSAANSAVGQTNLAAATNNYWQITGVQLEAGAVATPFEFEDYETTLSKCQRYFTKFVLSDTAPLATGIAYATTATATPVILPTRMRAAPTAVTSSNVGLTDYAAGYTITGLSMSEVSETNVRLLATGATGLTQSRPYVLRGDGNAAAHISISAEL